MTFKIVHVCSKLVETKAINTRVDKEKKSMLKLLSVWILIWISISAADRQFILTSPPAEADFHNSE